MPGSDKIWENGTLIGLKGQYVKMSRVCDDRIFHIFGQSLYFVL